MTLVEFSWRKIRTRTRLGRAGRTLLDCQRHTEDTCGLPCWTLAFTHWVAALLFLHATLRYRRVSYPATA